MWIHFAFLILFLVIYGLKNYFKILRLIFNLNGPKTVFILGNANAIVEGNLLEIMTNEAQNYSRIFRIWLTVLPYVVLKEPKDIKLVLNNLQHTQKIFFYKLFDNFLGKGLFTLKSDKWIMHRKNLQPVFNIHNLKKFVKIFGKHADHLVYKLIEKDGNVNITEFVNNSIYDIMIETIFGMKPSQKSSNAENTPFKRGQVSWSMVINRFARPWLLIDWIYRLTAAGKLEKKQQKNLLNFCLKKIKEKRELLSQHGSLNDQINTEDSKISLLDYMVEINEKNPFFTNQDIVEECCTFMLAGQDSVATATAITLFLLAKNPIWQKKCIAELDKIFDDDERSPTMQDLMQMTYLDMCIKESLRLYPSVPIFARTLRQDVRIGTYVIPAGCGVIISPYMTHRLPHHFPNPDDFQPERFSSQNLKKREPCAYMPFSGGPRDCIGRKFAELEIKSMVSAILRKCQLKTISDKDKIMVKFGMTIRARGGLWVNVRLRKL